VVIEVPVDEVH
jgi:ATP-dependent DNA helicase PIF1